MAPFPPIYFIVYRKGDLNLSIQKIIDIPTYVDLVALLGVKDKNLDTIRDDTSIKISVNKNNIVHLFGEENEVNRITLVFEKMMEYLDTQAQLSKEEVEWILQRSHNGEFAEVNQETILKYGKKEIKARTEGQIKYLESLRKNYITICIGGPGAGKTMVAVCYALSLLINKEIDKIIITRPMVEAKGENDLGALPGEVNDKLNLYMLPMLDVFERTLGKEKLMNYIEHGKIKMLPLGYMRGISLYKTCLIADEFENSNITLAKLLATRLGESSKIVICGDPIQQDSHGESGLDYLANSLQGVSGAGVVRMSNTDIVRHPMITRMLDAFERYDNLLRR